MAELLDADRIEALLNEKSRALIDRIEVLDVVPSTNTWLMQQKGCEKGRFRAVLAEHQTDGRGRQSRRWISPPGAGLCLSLGYTFRHSPPNISCLTLAAGVAVLRALRSLGCEQLKLKWPNDIYAGDAKLGGILTDAQTAPGGCITLICGVGLNVDLSHVDRRDRSLELLDYSITDLHSHTADLADRSAIAARVIEELATAFVKFEEGGLDPFRADWNASDWLKGRQVCVEMPDGQVTGTADGIDAHGALRLLTSQGRRRVFTGDVRVRPSEVA